MIGLTYIEECSMYTGNILGGSKSNNIANALEKAILANEYRQGELLPSQ